MTNHIEDAKVWQGAANKRVREALDEEQPPFNADGVALGAQLATSNALIAIAEQLRLMNQWNMLDIPDSKAWKRLHAVVLTEDNTDWTADAADVLGLKEEQ